MNEFAKEQEDKLREYYNNRLNQDEDMEMLNNMNKQNTNTNIKNYSLLNVINTNNTKNKSIKNDTEEKKVYNDLDLIDKYIEKIMTNINYSIYGIDEEEITFNDIEKLIKKNE